ncbi:MAG: PilZ domain-containing protein [Methylococcales bacterium]|nr:PilZ domain-containing protein [Methylococcales bacterium]
MRDSPEEVDIDDDFFDYPNENLSLHTWLKHDDLGIDPTMESYDNKRKTVRYIRNDIEASINLANIFGGYRSLSYNRPIKVKLLDISTKGALISSPKKIRMDKKIILTLIFKGQKKFEVFSKVIREEVYAEKTYGLMFDKARHDLGDYLLESQTELVFQDF